MNYEIAGHVGSTTITEDVKEKHCVVECSGTIEKTFTFSQLRTVAAYSQAVIKERVLHFMANTDPDYIPVFGRNLRMWSHDMVEFTRQDPEFNLSNTIVFPIMDFNLRDTLGIKIKNWNVVYIQFLSAKDALSNKSSPHKISSILLRINNYVLIRDEKIVSAAEVVFQYWSHIRERLSHPTKDLANSQITEFAQINNLRLGETFRRETKGDYPTQEPKQFPSLHKFQAW